MIEAKTPSPQTKKLPAEYRTHQEIEREILLELRKAPSKITPLKKAVRLNSKWAAAYTGALEREGMIEKLLGRYHLTQKAEKKFLQELFE
jgi:predicted transcriptional regulator